MINERNEIVKRCLERLNAIHYSGPAVASFWFTICSVVNKCIQFITVPLFTRLLSTTEYGEYSVFLSWQSIIIIIATLSLYANVFNNGMIKYKTDQNGFLSSLQGLTTTITIIIMMLFLVFGETVSSILELPLWIIIIMMLEIMVMPGFEYWAAKERFDYKYKKVIGITLAVAVLNPVVGLIFVENSSEKGLARILSVLVVQIIIYIFLYVINFIKGKKFYDKQYWKYALNLALPLVPHYLSQILLNQMDRIMISSICGNDKAGIYSVAYSAAMVMVIVGKAIQTSFSPWIYKSIEENKTENIKGTVNVLCIIMATANFLVICFAPEVIRILGGENYIEAIYVVPPLVASSFLIFIYSMFCTIEFYYEVTKPMMIVSIAGALLNFITNFVFIKLFGYYAAGYTTLFSYVFFVAVHYCVMKNALKRQGMRKKIYDEKFMILFTVLFVIGSVLMGLTYNTLLIRYLILLVLFFVVILIFLNKRAKR